MGFTKAAVSKRDLVIEELHKLKVFVTKQGQNIEDLNYDDLKYELVLATFRRIDIEKYENRWY
jgi:hypothetical protein